MLLLMFACAEEMKDTPADERVLAAPTVEQDGTGPWTGTLDVAEASAGAWELQIENVAVTLTTPTGVDLSTLQGQGVIVNAGTAGLWITDAAGAVLYLIETGSPIGDDDGDSGEPASAAFGQKIASRGETVGTFYDLGWQVDFGAIELDTDDGAVSIGPGAVDTVTLGGALYRAATIAQTKVSRYSDAASKCGPGDLLSFELLRIGEAAPAEQRARADGDAYAKGGCGG